LLAAGNAFDFPLTAVERERVDDGAADAALGVAEGRYRFDPADQPAARPLPHQRRAVAKLRKRKLERFQRHDAIAAGAFAFLRNRDPSLAILSFEKRGGGRDRQNNKSARPNDDRSVASERTHNQLVPPLRRGNHSYDPRPLPTKVILPYQGEQKVKLCANVRQCVETLRTPCPYVPA
jgi:hypothetical protein